MRLLLLLLTCCHLATSSRALQTQHSHVQLIPAKQTSAKQAFKVDDPTSSTPPVTTTTGASIVPSPVAPASSQTQRPARPPPEAPRRQASAPADDEYLVGVGIADITGPSADINLVSLIRRIVTATAGSSPSAGASGLASSSSSSSGTSRNLAVMQIQHPTLRELRDVKLQLKINLNSLLSAQTLSLIRWAMPSQVKIQAEYTYANLVVQL